MIALPLNDEHAGRKKCLGSAGIGNPGKTGCFGIADFP